MVCRIRDKVCEECRSKVSSSICPDDPQQAFLSIKNYSGAKEGLPAPSTSLVLALEQMETQYQRIIGDVIYTPRVKASLVQASCSTFRINCSAHHAISAAHPPSDDQHSPSSDDQKEPC